MTKRIIVLIVFLICSQSTMAFDLYPVKIHNMGYLKDQNDKVITEPTNVIFSVWQGGELADLDSGKELFREKVTVQPDKIGRYDVWLGSGENIKGKLEGPEFGLDKQLMIQKQYQIKEQAFKDRRVLVSVDNAYVTGWSAGGGKGLGKKAFKTYSPDFEDFAPEYVRRGIAILYPDGRLQTEEGSFVDTSQSNTTGVQEFFDYCSEHLVDGYIVGGSRPRAQQIIYRIFEPVRIRPAQGISINTGAICLQFQPEVGDAPGLTIDSCMMNDIRIRGLIHYLGKGYALAIKPENNLPLDTFVGHTIVDTLVYVTSVACRGAKGAVLFDGSINFSRFVLNEINHGDYGMRVAAGSGFSNNKILCKHIHGQEIANMLIEAGTANSWEVNLNCDGKDPYGIITHAYNDYWVAAVNSRNKPGIVLEPTARGNQFHLTGLSGGFVNKATRPTNRFYASPEIAADKIRLGYNTETPAVAATGQPVLNRNPFVVEVMIQNPGSVKRWTLIDVYDASVSFDAALTTGQTITLSPGEAVTLHYPEAKPTWKWRALH